MEAFQLYRFKKRSKQQIIEILTSLEELDDVQNIFTNANLTNYKL